MSRKIVGVTVGTPLGISAIKEKLNPVTSVNGVEADENGNVEITIPDAGGNVELDTTLTQSGKAADAKAVGDALNKKLSADELPNAVNDALARAKASGEFDGKDGVDGQDGYTPQKGIDYFDGKDGQPGKDGEDGYTPVKGVDYFDGQPGKDGKDGADGKTPVKGTDYYTEADKTEMVDAVLSALPTWTGGSY